MPSVALVEAHTAFLLPAKPERHSANLCRVPSRTRQKKLKRDGRTGKLANGTGERDGRTGRGRKLCRVPDAWHSAKIQTSPSAKLAALGEVSSFAECCQVGTRRSLDICRVPRVRHWAKFQTSPSVKVIALVESFFQEIEKWLLCRVSG